MVHERHFLPENDKKGHFFPTPPECGDLKFIYPCMETKVVQQVPRIKLVNLTT